jgi:hypothetical protein
MDVMMLNLAEPLLPFLVTVENWLSYLVVASRLRVGRAVLRTSKLTGAPTADGVTVP